MDMVSVIIPAYNQAKYLGAAIQSVLDQTYPRFEVIVVDDGSTDNTAAVVAGFSDPRVRYIRQENRGLSAARNTGIRSARGAYLSYLDSDDLFLPEKLALLTAELEDKPYLGLVAGQAIPIDEQGKQIGKVFDHPLPAEGSQLLMGNPLHVGSIVIRHTWQDRVGLFDENLRSYEDWDMWLRLLRAGCRTGWVNRPVSLYRFHQAQMTRIGKQMTMATFAVLDKIFSDPTLPDDWRNVRELAYSNAHLRTAAQAYRVHDFDTAMENLVEAVALDPELMVEAGEPLARRFIAWTDLPKAEDPLTYLDTIYDNLPEELMVLRHQKREELGAFAMRSAFAAFYKGDYARTRVMVWRALSYQLAWLKNRGVMSILVQSYIPFLRTNRCARPNVEPAYPGKAN